MNQDIYNSLNHLVNAAQNDLDKHRVNDVVGFLKTLEKAGIEGTVPVIQYGENDSFSLRIDEVLIQHDVLRKNIDTEPKGLRKPDIPRIASENEYVERGAELASLAEIVTDLDIHGKKIRNFGIQHLNRNSWALPITLDNGNKHFLKLYGAESLLQTGEIPTLQDLQGIAGVPQLIDNGEVDTSMRVRGDVPLIYTVTDFFEGYKTVRELLERNDFTISPKQAVHVIDQVLEVLEHVHGTGRLHRDISESNVMLNEEYNVKVIDFGTAKKIENIEQEVLVGIQGFIPPEYDRNYEREGTLPGPGSDLFQAGTLLYQLMTNGKYKTLLQIVGTKHANGNIKGEAERNVQLREIEEGSATVCLHELERKYRKQIGDVIRTAVDWKIEERYETAEEMRFALRLLGKRLPEQSAREIIESFKEADESGWHQYSPDSASRKLLDSPYSTQVFRELALHWPAAAAAGGKGFNGASSRDADNQELAMKVLYGLLADPAMVMDNQVINHTQGQSKISECQAVAQALHDYAFLKDHFRQKK